MKRRELSSTDNRHCLSGSEDRRNVPAVLMLAVEGVGFRYGGACLLFREPPRITRNFHITPAQTAAHSIVFSHRTALTPETRARDRRGRAIRTDGATVAAKLLLDAVSREKLLLSAMLSTESRQGSRKGWRMAEHMR
jgi:hypothetical protein